jgi:hypothetical protein|nr:MAG TPA: hypothetical protein [Caudoviricetes sp.]
MKDKIFDILSRFRTFVVEADIVIVFLRLAIFSALLYLITSIFLRHGDSIASMIVVSILIAVPIVAILDKYVEHRIELERMQELDINYFNTSKDQGVDPLDALVDRCLSNKLILTGFQAGNYVNNAQEQDLLREVLEEVSSSIGPLMKAKFELIYGKGHVEEILANKCFIRVSLFVADQNKARYVETDVDKSKIDKQLIDQMLMK